MNTLLPLPFIDANTLVPDIDIELLVLLGKAARTPLALFPYIVPHTAVFDTDNVELEFALPTTPPATLEHETLVLTLQSEI